MPINNRVEYPVDWSRCTVTLYESGNSPDYQYLYPPGVVAGRGSTFSWELKNAPKAQDTLYIECTGSPMEDMHKYNYAKIVFNDISNSIPKWFFITNKTDLNYPEDPSYAVNGYAIAYTMQLDVWETYKDLMGDITINLTQVTTNQPETWNDPSYINQDVVPFSGVDTTSTPVAYSDWKLVTKYKVGSDLLGYGTSEIDGLATSYRYVSGNAVDDYMTQLDSMRSMTESEALLFRDSTECEIYLVSSYFASGNGGRSQPEELELATPKLSGVHNRLNFPPYRTAYVWTIDGGYTEFSPTNFSSNMLPDSVRVVIDHSIVPEPQSNIRLVYDQAIMQYISFTGYATMSIDTATRTVWTKRNPGGEIIRYDNGTDSGGLMYVQN